VVCGALEDRDVSQDPEIGVQGGGLQAQNRRAAAAATRGILCPELADLLDDDDQPLRLQSAAFLDAEKSFRRILGYRDLWFARSRGRSK